MYKYRQASLRIECPLCPQSFANRTSYDRHIKMHQQHSDHSKCAECEELFKNWHRVLQHSAYSRAKKLKRIFAKRPNEHVNYVPYFCRYCCYHTIDDLEVFRHHVLSKHPSHYEHELTCEDYAANFGQHYSDDQPCDDGDSGDVQFCNVCLFNSRNKRILIRHRFDKHPIVRHPKAAGPTEFIPFISSVFSLRPGVETGVVSGTLLQQVSEDPSAVLTYKCSSCQLLVESVVELYEHLEKKHFGCECKHGYQNMQVPKMIKHLCSMHGFRIETISEKPSVAPPKHPLKAVQKSISVVRCTKCPAAFFCNLEIFKNHLRTVHHSDMGNGGPNGHSTLARTSPLHTERQCSELDDHNESSSSVFNLCGELSSASRTCPMCSKTFVTESLLQLHIGLIHYSSVTEMNAVDYMSLNE